MKQSIVVFLSVFFLFSCGDGKNNHTKSASAEKQRLIEKKTTVVTTSVVPLSEEQYRNVVYDFTERPVVWKFKGTRPCVVDFYAEWCRPCKSIAPFFDTLAREYAGKVDFYKVNVDYARGLSEFFSIQSIPMVMFCSEEQLQYANGAYPKEFYSKLIDSLLLHVY